MWVNKTVTSEYFKIILIIIVILISLFYIETGKRNETIFSENKIKVDFSNKLFSSFRPTPPAYVCPLSLANTMPTPTHISATFTSAIFRAKMLFSLNVAVFLTGDYHFVYSTALEIPRMAGISA